MHIGNLYAASTSSSYISIFESDELYYFVCVCVFYIHITHTHIK
jgi:hypothetical protein